VWVGRRQEVRRGWVAVVRVVEGVGGRCGAGHDFLHEQ
jgi:hypothetical protein